MDDTRRIPDERERSARIREFVVERFPLARQLAPQDGDSLLDSGIVDSLGILELVNFLGEAYGVEVGDDELSPENFGTIGGLVRFVGRKLDGPETGAA